MAVLDIKLLRDLRRLWAQALAISLVIAGGVATLVLAVGSHRSLDQTRAAYYERCHSPTFLVVRVRRDAGRPIAEIPGVAAVDARIARLALLGHSELREPASGQFISLPDIGEPRSIGSSANRSNASRAPAEVVVNENFANAHAFMPVRAFQPLLNGRKRELVIVGIALAGFIYTTGPGDIMPDDRRFGVIGCPKRLSQAYTI